MSPAQMKELNERLALWTIKGVRCWLTAIEVAALAKWRLERQEGVEYPWSYRPVAFALRRLARKGVVEERIVTFRGAHRSKEERREYRLSTVAEQAHPCPALFPTVMPVPAGAPRRVVRMED